MQNKNQLNNLKKKIIPILKKNGVVRAGIFGSYARGDMKKRSDVDVLVKIKDKKMSLLGFIHLGNELEEVLRKKIDLVEYEALKPSIKGRALREEIRIL